MRIFLFAVLLGWALPTMAQNAVVAEGAHVNLRTGKTDNYRVIRVLSPGTPVEILEADQNYAKVKTQEGDTGWLPARLLVTEPMDMHPAAESSPEQTAQPATTAHEEQVSNESAEQDTSFPWRLLVIGALCFVIGAAVGIAVHEAYYRKRLNGLRI